MYSIKKKKTHLEKRPRLSLLLALVALFAINLISSLPVSYQASSLPILIGYSSFPRIAMFGNLTLHFLPGETLWVQSNGQPVGFTNPSGNNVSLSSSGQGNITFFTYSFKPSDPVGSWKLSSSQSSADIFLDNTSTSLIGGIRYGISGAVSLTSQIENYVQRPLLLASGAMITTNGYNSIVPGQVINFTQNVKSLGQNVTIAVQYSQLISSSEVVGSVNETMAYNSTVESVVVPSSSALITMPQVHQVGPGGLVPLRYGLVDFVISYMDGTTYFQPSPSYVLPQKVNASVGSSSSIPERDLVNASDFQLVGVNYSSNSLVIKSYKLPLINFRVYDIRHKVFITNYQLGFSQQTKLVSDRAGQNTHVLIPSAENIQFLTPRQLPKTIMFNVSVYNFRILTNMKANVSQPQNIVVNVSADRLIVSSTLTPSNQRTNSNFTITSPAFPSNVYRGTWSNQTLFLPQGVYNITASHYGTAKSEILNLTGDANINFQFSSPIPIVFVGSLIAAGIEFAGLILLIIIRSRRLSLLAGK